MRWLQLLTASLLPFSALAAKKASGDRFSDFRTKSASGPLKLDDPTYTQLTKAPRDYSVIVLLTALGARFGCQLCQEFQPEWDLLAKSWSKGDKKGASRLIYGTLDFEDGKNTFQSVCRLCPSIGLPLMTGTQLMLQTAPIVLFFHPTSGPNAKIDTQPIRLDFTGG
jgi:oligosaccharyltransferase complex subunit gamma